MLMYINKLLYNKRTPASASLVILVKLYAYVQEIFLMLLLLLTGCVTDSTMAQQKKTLPVDDYGKCQGIGVKEAEKLHSQLTRFRNFPS